MSPSRDPFGFPAKSRSRRGKPIGTEPIIVVAQPGQEVRIVVPDAANVSAGILQPGDSRASPSGSGDSRASPSGSGDSRASPSGSGDSRASPSGSGDAQAQNPFAFLPTERGFSPAPLTVIARSGQEIRIVVPDETGSIPGFTTRPIPADSRASPSGSG